MNEGWLRFTSDRIETKHKINYGSAILLCMLGVWLLFPFPSYSFTESYSNRSFHFHTTAKIKLAFENKIRIYHDRATCAKDTVSYPALSLTL